MQSPNENKKNQVLRNARLQRHWSQRELAERLGTTVATVKRWERNVVSPSSYFRLKLMALFGKSEEELALIDVNALPVTPLEREGSEVLQTDTSTLTNGSLLWNVPYLRNPYFTGRDDLFDQLDQHFSSERLSKPNSMRCAALTKPQAIKGLGGIGKTQIAVEYAYRVREQQYPMHLLWINAASEETLMTSFVSLAELFPAFSAHKETDQWKLVIGARHWLEQCSQQWLLIFDNADNLSLAQEYLPQQGNGRILFTTRAHAVGSFATSIEVNTLGLIEGTQFLLRRAQCLYASNEEANEATNVVIALDGFPLALDQAGAFIEETGCCFSEYLRLYQEHRSILLARRGMQTTRYPDSVATTWSLSFQHIEQVNPAAAELLHLCAFLASDHIPEELLRDGAPYWTPLLQSAAANLLAFNQMIEDLLAFSLVKRFAKDHLLSIHRLVQAVQMDTMGQEEQYQWAERMVRAVNAVFPRHPKEDMTSWPQCLRYLEQVQACDMLIQKLKLTLTEGADLLYRTGVYLSEHASYAIAESLFQRALRILGQRLGPMHPHMVSSLNGLANLYQVQGKYTETEPLFQHVLDIYEQNVESEHVDVATAINGLANLYDVQERYTEAESLFQRALHIYEQNLGPEHLLMASPFYNLALLYRKQGKYTEAEPLFQRALRIWEQSLGAEHPEVAHPLCNLAELHCKQKKYTEAEPLFQRALRNWEQSLGAEHFLVTSLLKGLAELYHAQGKYTEAVPLFQRALSIQKHALEPYHPDIAETLHGFAALREAQGNSEKAVSLYRRALAIREKVYGRHHPKTSATHDLLRAVLQALGETEEVAVFEMAYLDREEREDGEAMYSEK